MNPAISAGSVLADLDRLFRSPHAAGVTAQDLYDSFYQDLVSRALISSLKILGCATCAEECAILRDDGVHRIVECQECGARSRTGCLNDYDAVNAWNGNRQ